MFRQACAQVFLIIFWTMSKRQLTILARN